MENTEVFMADGQGIGGVGVGPGQSSLTQIAASKAATKKVAEENNSASNTLEQDQDVPRETFGTGEKLNVSA